MLEPAPPPEPATTVDCDALLSPVHLSAFGLRREPPRSVDDRRPGYESLFDYDTLFYDVFRTGDGNGVICLGPPLLNCERALAGAEFRFPGASSPLACAYQPPRTDKQPTCRFHLSGPDVAAAPFLILHATGRSIEIPIRGSGTAAFAGKEYRVPRFAAT